MRCATARSRASDMSVLHFRSFAFRSSALPHAPNAPALGGVHMHRYSPKLSAGGTERRPQARHSSFGKEYNEVREMIERRAKLRKELARATKQSVDEDPIASRAA